MARIAVKPYMYEEIAPINLTLEELEDALNVARLEKMASKHALENIKNISFISNKPRNDGWWNSL
jgi:hypothetical protein